MSRAIVPSPSANRPDAVASDRVLFALTAAEKEAFFPDGVESLAGLETLWQPEGPMPRQAWIALLEEFQPTVVLSCWSTPPIPPSLAAAGSPLGYVCHLVGSVRSLVPRVFLERGGLLSNWGSLAGEGVAEHAILLALSALRRQAAWLPLIQEPQPRPWRNGTMRLRTRTLIGRRVAIHGFGHVARALARMLRAFNVEIRAFSQGVPAQLMRDAGVSPCASLLELAEGSDVFFECEALTPQSRGSIDARVLAALPDDAVFVNVGRGPLVDETALLREASSGRIRLALDVVTHEPVRPESPLLAIPESIISPHIGGPTYDRFADCGRLALANIRRYLRGEPPEARVTLELYDRAT